MTLFFIGEFSKFTAENSEFIFTVIISVLFTISLIQFMLTFPLLLVSSYLSIALLILSYWLTVHANNYMLLAHYSFSLFTNLLLYSLGFTEFKLILFLLSRQCQVIRILLFHLPCHHFLNNYFNEFNCRYNLSFMSQYHFHLYLYLSTYSSLLWDIVLLYLWVYSWDPFVFASLCYLIPESFCW